MIENRNRRYNFVAEFRILPISMIEFKQLGIRIVVDSIWKPKLPKLITILDHSIFFDFWFNWAIQFSHAFICCLLTSFKVVMKDCWIVKIVGQHNNKFKVIDKNQTHCTVFYKFRIWTKFYPDNQWRVSSMVGFRLPMNSSLQPVVRIQPDTENCYNLKNKESIVQPYNISISLLYLRLDNEPQ